MDRDIALGISTVLNNMKTALQALASNTSPFEPVGLVGASPDRSIEDIPEDPKEPEEPVTKDKK